MSFEGALFPATRGMHPPMHLCEALLFYRSPRFCLARRNGPPQACYNAQRGSIV
jgi:hypothetical protein